MPETRENPLICCVHGGRWYAHFLRQPEVKGYGTTRRYALKNLESMLGEELGKADRATLKAEIKGS